MKAEKRNLKKWLIGVAVVLGPLLVFSVLCVCEAFRYPRIARSGYLRHPLLLAAATWSRVFPGEGVSKETVLAHAAGVYPDADLDACRVYLSDEPRNDKCIRDRVFGMMSKRGVETEERLFWIVSAAPRSAAEENDWLVYEYRTGKLVDSSRGLQEQGRNPTR